MIRQRSVYYHRSFDLLIPSTQPAGTAAEVCPDSPNPIPAPSDWASSALRFNPDPIQKQVLDHPAHRLILCCARQWGKTTIVAIKALHTAVFFPGSRILVLSKSLKQANLLLAVVSQSAAILGFRRKRVLGFQGSLLLPNGSQIFAVANSETGTRGYSATIVIVDEAAMIPDDVIGAASPTLGRSTGKLWLLSTPHGETGIFYHVWHDSSLSDWYKVKATIEDSPYASPAFIAEQKRLFPLNFRQDFYCEFLPAKGALLSRDRVDKLIDPSIPYIPFPKLSKELK
jgi:hypothetical protein